MLLILTSERDLAADYLIVHLRRKGLPFHRLNVEHYHQQHASFALTEAGISRQLLTPSGESIDLNAVHSVWYRRAIHPNVDVRVPPSQHQFVAGEERHFWAGLILSSSVHWVNPIDKVSVGELKLVQLAMASKLGFVVPRTLVSRDVKALRQFVVEVGSAVSKPIYHGLLVESQGRSSAYTRRITAGDLDDEASISVSPVLLQAEVPRRADIRLTLVGETIFAVRITSADTALIDWRKPGLHLSYASVEPPPQVAALCRAMLGRMGLVYGAFDFIEDHDGRWVFLEINPTGEWAWLEDQLGLPFRDAFVRLFYDQ